MGRQVQSHLFVSCSGQYSPLMTPMATSHCDGITNAGFFNRPTPVHRRGFQSFSMCVAGGCCKRFPQAIATTSSRIIFLRLVICCRLVASTSSRTSSTDVWRLVLLFSCLPRGLHGSVR